MPTIKIEENSPIVTVISIFTVSPTHQKDLLALLAANGTWLCQRPGFIGASIHTSAASGHVVNYAQWRDVESLKSMLREPRGRDHAAHVAAIASVEVLRCAIDSVFLASESGA